MGFLGKIEYDFDFIQNLLIGFTICIPYFILVFRFVYSALAKAVLIYGALVYIMPFQIVRKWAYHSVTFEHLLITYIFMLEYLLIYKLTSLQNDKYNKVDKKFIYLSRFALNNIIIIVMIILILWLIYFIINPSYSSFFLYLSNMESRESVRFVFYETPNFLQLLYAVTGRVIVPVGILYIGISGRIRSYILILLLSIFVLLQSGERQNIFLLTFCMLILIFVPSRFKRFHVLFLLMIAPPLLFLIFTMQGNIAADEDNYLVIFNILFNRVVADPFYMFSNIFETYNGNLMYGGTNKIFGFLGTDTVGWSAIGIIPDAWINYGYVGILVAPIMYALLLTLAVHFIGIVRQNYGIFVICNLLFSIAFISLYYSNLFSLVPMFVYIVACAFAIMTKYKISLI